MQHMGFDVVNEQKLKDVVIDPALTRIETVTVPAIEAAGHRLVAQIEEALSRQVAGLIGGLVTAGARLLETADGDISKLLAGLDGWNLQISVRLTAPKSQGVESPAPLAFEPVNLTVGKTLE